MKLLALDTSTKNFSLAVVGKGKTLASQDVVLDKILSDSIIPSIDKVLKKAKVSLDAIDGIAVGLGPGSFTSLRVGLSTVKGLAFSAQKPVVGIPSLDIIAANIQKDADQICVINDARRNMVYCGWFEKKIGHVKRKGEYVLNSVMEILENAKGEVVFTGDGIDLYKKDIEKSKVKAVFADKKSWYPKAEKLAELALPKFERKEYDNLDKLVPVYLYPEDCQVQK